MRSFGSAEKNNNLSTSNSDPMKRFISKTIVTILVPTLPFLVMELLIEKQKEGFFEEKALEKRYAQDANDYAWIETLDNGPINILAGSSSVRYGLSCKELNNINPDNSSYVNLAMDARGPIQTYFILKNLGLDSVRTIYFGLDPWIYTKRYYRHRNQYLYLDFTTWECFLYSREHDKSAFVKRYKSFFRYLFLPQPAQKNRNITTPDDYGSSALQRTAKNFDDLSDWFQIEKYGWSGLQFEYLRKIEKLCEENKINFHLFIPPKRSDYCEYYLEKYKAIHEGYTSKIAQTGIDSSIFGRFDIFNDHVDSTLFAEAFHLNKKGQIEFSRLFYELSLKQSKRFTTDYLWFAE